MGIALLLGIVAAHQYGLMPALSTSGQTFAPTETTSQQETSTSSDAGYGEMVEKRLHLKRLERDADKINAAYMAMAPQYAEQMSQIAGYVPSIQDAPTEAVAVLQDRLQSFDYLKDLKIIPSTAQEVGAGVQKATVDISFSTLSSEEALQVLFDLSDSKQGILWQELNLTTNRQKREVVVSGRVDILMIEAAE